MGLKQIVFYTVVGGLFISIYLIRFYITRPSFQEGDRIRITGTIQEEPIFAEGRQKIMVGDVRAYLPQFPEYRYGDRVIIEGVAAKGKGGWFFKKVEKVEKVENVEKGLLGLREKILGLFGKFLPEPHSALLKGIVLGTKSSLDFEFFEELRKTGTLHIVVASGANIALFAGGLLNVLAVLIGRRRAIWPALVAVWVYVFLVGWQPPIIRAAVMGSLAFVAQALGKEFDAWRALFISAFGLLIFEPAWLFDVGFQLSFAATAGILILAGRIRDRLLRVPGIFRENLATTLAAQIFVSPIIFFNFGQVSLISPLVNALVLWTVPPIMLGGMITGAMGVMWEPFGQVMAWFIWLPLEYFVRIVGLFAQI